MNQDTPPDIESRAAEVDRVAGALARCVGDQATEHDVAVPFALARVLAERVAHDGGTLDDCIALVRAADASRDASACAEPWPKLEDLLAAPAIKLRLATDRRGGFAPPSPSPFPRGDSGYARGGEQFIVDDGRAFSVTLVEHRHDLNEVHLFCREFFGDPDGKRIAWGRLVVATCAIALLGWALALYLGAP